MSVLTTALDAIATALNAEGFPLAFVAEASLRPRVEAKQLQSLRVLVTPGTITHIRQARGVLSRNLQVHVAIQARITDEEQIGEYLTLAEQIEGFLAGRLFDGRFLCTGTEREQPFAIDHLDEMAVFTTIITVTLSDTEVLTR